MNDIRQDLKELSNIIEESKRVLETLNKMRERKKELELRLIDYLATTDEVGLKYESFIFIPKDKKIRKRLKKKERDEKAVQVLSDYGVDQAKEAYEKLMDAMKGEEEIVSALKISEAKDE